MELKMIEITVHALRLGSCFLSVRSSQGSGLDVPGLWKWDLGTLPSARAPPGAVRANAGAPGQGAARDGAAPAREGDEVEARGGQRAPPEPVRHARLAMSRYGSEKKKARKS